MTIKKPYRRTSRPFNNNGGYHAEYAIHPKFAVSPEHYVRAYLLILKDIKELFDYVEPADINIGCFSYRIHSLLVRACIEVEANCRAILKENGYEKKSKDGNPARLNMGDYKLIENSHHLSSFEVKVSNWHGENSIRAPFTQWKNGNSLDWYEAYHSIKHDRHIAFMSAKFDFLIDSVCGLVVILAAQFEDQDFSNRPNRLVISNNVTDGFQSGIGDLFRIKFPDDWPEEQTYNFTWNEIKDETDPFQDFDYNNVSKRSK